MTEVSRGEPVQPGDDPLKLRVLRLLLGGSWRMHQRPPSFMNLQALAKMAEGRLLADIVAIIGSIDIILGEIDR